MIIIKVFRYYLSVGLWKELLSGSKATEYLSKYYEYHIDTSETMIQLAMIRLMLNRIEK